MGNRAKEGEHGTSCSAEARRTVGTELQSEINQAQKGSGREHTHFGDLALAALGALHELLAALRREHLAVAHQVKHMGFVDEGGHQAKEGLVN